VDFTKLTRLVFNRDLPRVKRSTDDLAPHSLVNFSMFDPTHQMQLFRHRTRAVTYMMSDNVIIEKCFGTIPASCCIRRRS
jgi:hypothetical protein